MQGIPETSPSISQSAWRPFSILAGFVLCFFAVGSIRAVNLCYLQDVIGLDSASRQIPASQKFFLLSKIKEKAEASGHACFPVPQKLTQLFYRNLESFGRLNEDDVARIIESSLVPHLSNLIVFPGEQKDEKLKQSFLSYRKAREYETTADHIEGLMSARFLFAVYAAKYVSFRTGSGGNESWTSQCQMGVVVIELSREGNEFRSQLRVRASKPAIGLEQGRGEMGSFMKMSEAGARQLEGAMKEVLGFSVTRGSMRKKGSGLVLQVTKKEGRVRVDDLYLIRGPHAGEDPNDQSCKGWLAVTKTKRESSAGAFKIRGRIIKGSLDQGDVVVTYPRLPFEVQCGYHMVPVDIRFKAGVSDSLETKGPCHALEAGAFFNAGKWIGVCQLFIGGTYAFGLGSASGYEGGWGLGKGATSGYTLHCLEVPVCKRFGLRRFVLEAGGSYFYKRAKFKIDGSGFVKSVANSGFSICGGPGFAISPALRLQLLGKWDLAGETTNWKYESSGIEQVPRLRAPTKFGGLSLRAGAAWSIPPLRSKPE